MYTYERVTSPLLLIMNNICAAIKRTFTCQCTTFTVCMCTVQVDLDHFCIVPLFLDFLFLQIVTANCRLQCNLPSSRFVDVRLVQPLLRSHQHSPLQEGDRHATRLLRSPGCLQPQQHPTVREKSGLESSEGQCRRQKQSIWHFRTEAQPAQAEQSTYFYDNCRGKEWQ